MKKTVKGINICNCCSGLNVNKSYYEIKKETSQFYIINYMGQEVKILKEQTWEQKYNKTRNEVRDIYTKSYKLVDHEGKVLAVYKNYFKFHWAELVY